MCVDAQHFQLLQHFTVILYDMTCGLHRIDEARKELFFQKGKTMEGILPTQDVLLQHSLIIRLEYGVPMNRVNNTYLLQKAGAGL